MKKRIQVSILIGFLFLIACGEYFDETTDPDLTTGVIGQLENGYSIVWGQDSKLRVIPDDRFVCRYEKSIQTHHTLIIRGKNPLEVLSLVNAYRDGKLDANTFWNLMTSAEKEARNIKIVVASDLQVTNFNTVFE